jgi:hypothetical protein
MGDAVEQLSSIIPSERILLLPHCLRKSNSCKATYDKHGLKCAGCNPDCSVNKLRREALKHGYKGVCVAPGGHMAVNFIREYLPKAIVAIACAKELEEGIGEVKKWIDEKIAPIMVIVPLLKDGCLDTEVDEARAIEVIAEGCVSAGSGT